VWLDIETNEWISNTRHYSLPTAFARATGLERDLEELDAADGRVDGAWGEHDILGDRTRVEETPAFIVYHTRTMIDMLRSEGYGRDRVADLLFTNYKQIDRVGHYFNMSSDEVRQSLEESDRQLAELLDHLDRSIGRDYLVVLTADHGQQPDARAVDGYGINPTELERDVNAEFGPVARAAWPTEVFLELEELRARRVSIAEVARFIADYRLEDNIDGWDSAPYTGEVELDDRLFALAAPSEVMAGTECAGS
jgi:hypothetical protein